MTGAGREERPGSPLLDLPGAVAAEGLDDGVAWHYGDPVAEQRALAAGTAVTDLSHRGVVRLTGDERLPLLETLTTQRLRSLAPGGCTEALMLSTQGHVDHELHLVDDGEATWITVEPGGVLGLTERIRQASVGRNVDVRDLTGRIAVLGESGAPVATPGAVAVWDDPWPQLAPGSVSWTGIAPAEHPGAGRRWREVLVPRGELADRVGGRRLAGSWASEALRVEAWRPRADAEGRAGALAHELDWLRTAAHPDAGPCPGWETVRWVPGSGAARQRLVMMHLDGSESVLPEVAAPVLLDGHRVGTTTSVARHHELGPVALAVVLGRTPPEAVVEISGVPAAQELIVSS